MVVIESIFKDTKNKIYKIDQNNDLISVIKDSIEWEHLLTQFKGHELKSYITRGLIRQVGNHQNLSMSDIYPDENMLWPSPFPWKFYGFSDYHIVRTVDNYAITPEEYVEGSDNVYISNDILPQFTELKKELYELSGYDNDVVISLTQFLKLLYLDYVKHNKVKFFVYDPSVYPPRDRV